MGGTSPELRIPQIVDLADLQAAVTLERTHRIEPSRENKTLPCSLITKFLNYKDEMRVLDAAGAKGEIWGHVQPVHVYPDLPARITHLGERVDPVRKNLLNLGICHGVILTRGQPARSRPLKGHRSSRKSIGTLAEVKTEQDRGDTSEQEQHVEQTEKQRKCRPSPCFT